MYGKWLFKEIKTEYGHCKVEIFRKDYEGEEIEIEAIVKNSLTLSLENLNAVTDPIGKSVCSLEIINTNQINYDELFTPDATALKVIVSTRLEDSDYVTRWSGYLTPDFFAENLSYRTPISISARDNIGYLSDVDFDLDVATITVRELIQAAFNRIAEDYPMELVFETQKQTEDGILTIDATISTYLLRGMTWYEAIETVLHDLGLQMRWVDNNAIAIMDISQLGEIFALQRFNFIDNSGYREILPAWRELAQEQSYGVLDNFYKGHIDGESKLEYATNSAINSNILLYQPKSITQWSRQGEVYFLNFYNSYNAEIDDDKQDAIFITGVAPSATNADVLGKKMVYSQAVTEVDKQIKMTFSLNDTLRTPLASQYSRGERNTLYLPYRQSSGNQMLKVPHPYQLKYRFNIFLRANDGTNYVMREDWVEEAALNEQPFIEFLTDKLQIVDTGVTDGQGNHRFAYTGYNNSKEYSITIGYIPKAGTLEFVVYPWTFEKDDYSSARDAATYQRGAKISKIEFRVQVGKTGVEARTQIGVLHNIAEKINYSFGQVPQREGDVITYAGGLFQSDTITALQGFRRNANSTTYPLIELVGREVIHFNKKNYTKLSGTAKNLAKEPLMFNKLLVYKGKNYLPFACSLDVISNRMNITTMQEVEPYITHSFVEIKSELVTGGGATISGGNNTALQYSAEVGNAKRISELNNASESEKKESYIVIDNANWNESKKVPLSEMEGLDAEQVEEYLTENKYAKQSWVKGITDDLETDIANRVLIEDFDKLQEAVDLNYANLNKAITRISTLEGYFSNGVANNAAKLGGQLPSYYATKSALDTTNTNLSNLSTTVGTIAGNLSSLTGRVSTAEDTIKGHTSSISKAVADIAANAKNISTNAVAITTLNNKVAKLESYWYIDDNGNLHTTYNIVSDKDVVAGGEYSGGSSGGGATGLGTVTIKTVSGQEYKTDSNGVVTIPDYQPKGNYLTAVPSGYATESWVGDNYQPKGNYLTAIPTEYITESELTAKGYLTGITSAMVTTALGYVPFNSTSFTKATIKSTLGIADWALAASKPTYTASEVGALSESGGTLTGDLVLGWHSSAGSKSIAFTVESSGNKAYLYADAYDLKYLFNNQYNTLIHSGNIGSQSVKRSNYVATMLVDGSGFYEDTYRLFGQWASDNNNICDWKAIGYEVRVDRARKLNTARTIWGQSFDGTADISGNLVATGITCDHITRYDSNAGYLFGSRNTALGLTDGGALVYAYGNTPVSMYTNGLERARVTGSGNVLIGTTIDSGAKLHINASAATTLQAVTTTAGLGIAQFLAPNARTGVAGGMVLDFGVASSTYNSGNIAFRHYSSGNVANFVSIGLYGNDNILNVFGSGNVAIGTTDSNPAYKLDVQGGDVRFTGNLAVYGDGVFGSDARYKSKLQDLAVDLTTIANAPVFSYKWTDREDDKVHLGTTAQYWLDTNFKDAVDASNKDFYHLNYGGLGVAIGVTVAKKVVNHEERILALERENIALKNELNQLKQWHN